MRGGDDGEDTAGAREGSFEVFCGVAKLTAQGAKPESSLCVGVVEKTAPYAIGVGVFFPIPVRHETGVGVGGAAAGDS